MMRLWVANFAALGASVWANKQTATNGSGYSHSSDVFYFVPEFGAPIGSQNPVHVVCSPALLRFSFFLPRFRRLAVSAPFAVIFVVALTVFGFPLFVVGRDFFFVGGATLLHSSQNFVAVLLILLAVVFFLTFFVSVGHGENYTASGIIFNYILNPTAKRS